MTKAERSAEMSFLVERYSDIGKEIKEKLLSYNSQFGDKFRIDEDDFFQSFAPLYGDTAEAFNKFKSYFELI